MVQYKVSTWVIVSFYITQYLIKYIHVFFLGDAMDYHVIYVLVCFLKDGRTPSQHIEKCREQYKNLIYTPHWETQRILTSSHKLNLLQII